MPESSPFTDDVANNNPFQLPSGTHSHDHSHPHSHEHASHPPTDARSITTNLSSLSPGYNPSVAEIRQFYPLDPSMDIDEASYLIRTILSFKYYQRNTLSMNHVRMQSFYALPEKHRQLLQPQFTDKLVGIDEAIEKNAVLARLIATVGEEMYTGGMEVKMGGPLSPKKKYVMYSCTI
jgi:hypothetical protein